MIDELATKQNPVESAVKVKQAGSKQQ
jgi:hypothetical protein